MSENKAPEYEGPAIVELMGHVRLGGMVREATIAGAGFLRIDIPSTTEGETYATQYISPGALYRLTPCSEEAMHAAAAANQPQPVQRWELPHKPTSTVPLADETESDFDDATKSEIPF